MWALKMSRKKATFRHSSSVVFYKKLLWKIPKNSLEKTPGSFFWYSCFPVNFAHFLRTPFLQNTSGWLFLFLSRNSGICTCFVFGKIADLQPATLSKKTATHAFSREFCEVSWNSLLFRTSMWDCVCQK